MTNGTKLALAAVVTLFALPFGNGCGAKATKADCEKMVGKMLDVELEGSSPEVAKLAKESMAADRDKMIAECDGKVRKSDVDCVLAAKTKADVDKCGN